jgi:hypothetical protein
VQDNQITQLLKESRYRQRQLTSEELPATAPTTFDPPRWLSPGDVVEVEVSNVGTLRNTIIDETTSYGRSLLRCQRMPAADIAR